MKLHHTLILLGTLLIFSCSPGGKNEEGAASDSTATQTAPPDAETAEKDTLEISGHIEFPSKDGLMITADSYESLPGKDFILLCHQAGYSRGEYIETAKRLNDMGYNCLAIDQRSGGACNGVTNLTAKALAANGIKNATYADAEQDIVAAIDYMYAKSGKKIIAVGSSYSAALLLKIAKTNDKISAVAVFSPGEYLEGTDLKKEITGLNLPVFATCSRKEAKEVSELLSGVISKEIFVPTSQGDHGSKVLWSTSEGHEEYWKAFEAFLKKNTQATI